jgi:site-specific DNA-methyltransferase (adenine-specific)
VLEVSNYELHLGDCLEYMRTLEDGAVDAVITDPPYTQRVTDGARTNTFQEPKRFITFDGIDGLEAELCREFLRVSRTWTIVFCAFEQLGDYARASGDFWVRSGVFHKPDATPQFSGDRPSMCGEAIAIMHAPGKKRWNGGGRPAFWSYSREQNRNGHPTQKPISLMKRIVYDFTMEDYTILDPFMGSGTTGVACMELGEGRRFIGCEVDPKYYQIAEKRIYNSTRQGDLFT